MMPLKDARVTYPYGVKNSRYIKGYHTGIDLASSDYTIRAVAAGTIQEARYAPGKGADPNGWGNYVILRTVDKKYDIIHAHLSSVAVTKGQTLSAGAILGQMGSTGQSTGPHLHFEVRKVPWTARNDVDPAIILKKGDQDMLDKIVIYADGDIGAAITFSQSEGCPMVRSTEKDLEAIVKRFPAKMTYLFGFDGKDSSGRKYFKGQNRKETAKEALK
jgi:murein DD-endopeptidase MepM/ murein hydrolase activator NlpD